MGVWWDWLSGADARRWGHELLRRKYPASRGLSAETMSAVEAGALELEDDGHPQLHDPEDAPDDYQYQWLPLLHGALRNAVDNHWGGVA